MDPQPRRAMSATADCIKGPRVCVIGAGAAGLTTMKQLKDVGITDMDCFEKEFDVGGIFHYGLHKNGVYDNAVLTISNYLMAFSDMPPAGHRYHWHHSEYKDYLEEYARRFHLKEHIYFGTTVREVAGEPGRWQVKVEQEDGTVIDRLYDAVAVCSGAHQAINQPSLPGLDTFTGEVVHSSAYKNNAPFAGKDCVVVGLGESGADIVREISEVARSTVLALRSYPYLIPRLARPFHENPFGCPSDAFTSHLRHDLLNVPRSRHRRFKHFVRRLMFSLAALLFLIFPCLGRGREKPKKDAFNQDASKVFLDKETPEDKLSSVLIYSWCNRSGQQEHGQKFACKNVTFVKQVVDGRIQTNDSGIVRIDGGFVVFGSGARVKCDCLVMCTGYRDVFPFLKGNVGRSTTPLAVPEGNVRRLYKHIFHPDVGASLAFIGFVRPTTGGIPPCAEMAARYFALVLSGQRQLPRNLAELTRAECELDTKYYRLSPDVKTLVGYKDWMDSMAELVGCEVKLMRYVLRPRLFVRLCLGSLLPSQYRLRGPGKLPELSMATILSVPVAATPSQSAGEAWRSWLRHLGIRPLFAGDV
eukprot:TRINITY_DN3661_c0_g2_i1.p1 TRINITY_DN3661_c0_g2~~TRINITY_DN3661_c0_g2_i1.p1  ORF type:complete len:585 (-),score=94.66 TRINITY_DN3661_c0_g2_i1:164-1918(-)